MLKSGILNVFMTYFDAINASNISSWKSALPLINLINARQDGHFRRLSLPTLTSIYTNSIRPNFKPRPFNLK